MDYILPIPIISAPSGAGKTTIAKGLIGLSLGKYGFSVSNTTRPMRPGEVEGKDYYFSSTLDFKNRVINNQFLEWQEVYNGQFYGTLKSEINRLEKIGVTPVFDVDVIGALDLKKKLGEKAVTIFIEPPSMKVLEKRLRGRKTDSEEQILKRLKKAEEEMEAKPLFDFRVVNKHGKQDDTIARCHRFLLSKVGFKP